MINVSVQSRRGSFPAACLQTSCHRETTPPRRGSHENSRSRQCSPVQALSNQIPRSSSHSKLVTIATMNSAKHRQQLQHPSRHQHQTSRRYKKHPLSAADADGIKRSHSNNVLSMVHHGIDSVENTDDDDDSDVDGHLSTASSRHTHGSQIALDIITQPLYSLREIFDKTRHSFLQKLIFAMCSMCV